MKKKLSTVLTPENKAVRGGRGNSGLPLRKDNKVALPPTVSKSLPRPGLESQARFQLKCPALPKKLCLETSAAAAFVVDVVSVDVVASLKRF